MEKPQQIETPKQYRVYVDKFLFLRISAKFGNFFLYHTPSSYNNRGEGSAEMLATLDLLRGISHGLEVYALQ